MKKPTLLKRHKGGWWCVSDDPFIVGKGDSCFNAYWDWMFARNDHLARIGVIERLVP